MLNKRIDIKKHSVYYSGKHLFAETAMSKEADKEIILKLGGSTKVAELLGYKNKQRVQNWMSRGIPPKVKLQYPHLFLNTNIHSNDAA